jgi:putative ABC transport system permease protein
MKLLPWEYAVRNLGRSPLKLVLSIAGSALVVLLMLAAGAFVRGMEKSLRATGDPRNVILLGAGSEESIERSEIDPAAATLVNASVPGIRAALGVPYICSEAHMMAEVKLDPADSRGVPAQLRGVSTEAFLVHSQVQISEGRAPEAGRDQLLAGALAHRRLGVPAGRLAVGQTLWLDNRPWTIAGRFDAPGTVMEAEIWLPVTDLQIVARRDSLSAVVLTLDWAEFGDVDVFCRQRLDLELVAMREVDYYAKLAEFYGPVRVMVWATALLIAGGGLLGGLNTMYATFASRVRELAALQAMGFPRRALLLSLVQESLLTTATGALLACIAAILLLDGLAVEFSSGAFGMVVDWSVVLLGLASGLVLGIAGALPPAWRCLRMPITMALKAN